MAQLTICVIFHSRALAQLLAQLGLSPWEYLPLREGSCCLRERLAQPWEPSRYFKEEVESGPPHLLIPSTLCPASRDPHIWHVKTLRQNEKLSKPVSAGVGPWGTSCRSIGSYMLSTCD